MNAVILTAVLSAVTRDVCSTCGARHPACDGKAPRILQEIVRGGVPRTLYATTVIAGCLAFDPQCPRATRRSICGR